METFTVYTEQAVEAAVRERAKSGKWYVLHFNGYTFKIYGRWAQIKQSPDGLRDSGFDGHKSARALCAELSAFMRG